MDTLPIPKLRASWVAALIVAIFMFIAYYIFAFQALIQLYRSQYYEVQFEDKQSNINITAFIPKYYSPSEPIWAYLTVQNNSDMPIYDIEVSLISSSDEPTLLLPKLYNEETFNSVARFNIIESHSTSTARISFITQSDPLIEKVLLTKINADQNARKELERQKSATVVKPSKFGWRTLQHSFLETILLPPWSNGFILALVLFSVYIVRRRKEEDGKEFHEPKTFSWRWWVWVWKDIWKSLKVLYVMMFVVIVLLLLNYETLPQIIFLVSLQLLWIARLYLRKGKLWRGRFWKRTWKYLPLVAILLLALGIARSIFTLLFSITIYFFEFGFVHSVLSELIIWFASLIAALVLWVRYTKNAEALEKVIERPYLIETLVFIMGMVYLLTIHIFDIPIYYKPINVDVSYSWKLVGFGSVLLFSWSKYFFKHPPENGPGAKTKIKGTFKVNAKTTKQKRSY